MYQFNETSRSVDNVTGAKSNINMVIERWIINRDDWVGPSSMGPTEPRPQLRGCYSHSAAAQETAASFLENSHSIYWHHMSTADFYFGPSNNILASSSVDA